MSLIPGLGKFHLEEHFDAENLVYTTTTFMGRKKVHEHVLDMTPVFEEFKRRIFDEIEFTES